MHTHTHIHTHTSPRGAQACTHTLLAWWQAAPPPPPKRAAKDEGEAKEAKQGGGLLGFLGLGGKPKQVEDAPAPAASKAAKGTTKVGGRGRQAGLFMSVSVQVGACLDVMASAEGCACWLRDLLALRDGSADWPP